MIEKQNRIKRSWYVMVHKCKKQNLSKHWDTFQEFYDWAQESGYNENFCLIRRDTGDNYSPSNCFWGSPLERNRHRKGISTITYNGKTQSLHSWAKELGYSSFHFQTRFNCSHLTLEEKFKPKPVISSCTVYDKNKVDKLRWRHNTMKRSCQDKNSSRYLMYGAKGITLCQEWETFENFERWAYSNGYSENLCLIRKDKLEGFNPQNCFWGTRTELQNSRSDVWKLFDGKNIVYTRDLSKTLKISRTSIYGRLETCKT
jgi:hypothetical protein